MDDLWDKYIDVGRPATPVLTEQRGHDTGGRARRMDASSRTGTFSMLSRPRKVRFFERLEQTLYAFSPGERLALYLLSTIFALSALVLVAGVNALASVTVPSEGGTLVEGEVGPARFINPLLTLSQPDQDLAELIYSGLVRALPDGSFVPDLAQSYSVSADGTVYTFKLRPNATFQDGTKVTSADVLFTIQEALDPAINSPHRADWTGVQVSAPDEETVVFTLPHAYAPFIEDATLGILPKHLWQNVSAEEFPFNPLNTHPIGSGPYKIDTVSTDKTGAAVRYDLSAFKDYTLGMPHLAHIAFVFYTDEDALIKGLNAGAINAVAAPSPEELATIKRSDIYMAEAPLPRVFGVFFNQSHNPVLADSGVRQALDVALNKQALVNSTFLGRAQVLSGPIPLGTLGDNTPATPEPLMTNMVATSTDARGDLAAARAILMKDGWKFESTASSSVGNAVPPAGVWTKDKRSLAFTLATADQPEFVASGKAIVAAWQSLGVQATLQIYPLAELNTTIIRPRSYDALLFGEVVGPELDLYAFWHSSQRNDPGLNLALYANPKTDQLLSDARASTDETHRIDLYRQFASLLVKDEPAIFLYSPDFLYLVPRNLQGVELGTLSDASDRFENVYQWYTNTENIWKIFLPATN